MARSTLLNTRTANFLDLVGNGRIYRVPPYQRDYSWAEEQWDDLWEDVAELRKHSEERHYMGAVVVEGKSDREFLVIDGQQRLATISIFILAVIDKLQALAERGVQAEENRERAAALRARFIGEKDPASLVENSKVSLNETDDGFYQDYVVQLRPPINPRRLPRSNRLLWECYLHFRRCLDEEVAFEDGEAVAQLASEVVGRQLLFILITVDDELNAYTVFETLNARGIALSTTDLLKNYLFSRLRSPGDLEAVRRRWQSLIGVVRQERFPELLRYHLLCEQETRVRSERLFKLVRMTARTPHEVFHLMDALEHRGEIFSALSDPTHEYWAENPDCRPYVRELVLFRVRQSTPLLFAAWERFSREDFARVLKLVSVLSFRHTIVGGRNTNALESVYQAAARAVLRGTAGTPREVFERLREIFVDDAQFESDFASLQLDTGGQRKRLAKYVLARLESSTGDRACDPETDPATIEHILPENPSAEWEDAIPAEQWAAAVYRLGNMTLLEPALNRAVANAPFGEKLDAYARSAYVLARRLAERGGAEWTFAHIEERQRGLARRAVHVWRPDFA